MTRHHLCPNCQTHIGWGRIFLARPITIWPCPACGFPLRWVDPPARTKLVLGLIFGAVAMLLLGGLAMTDLPGAWRLALAALLAGGLAVLFQLLLARVGPAGGARRQTHRPRARS